MLAKRLTDMTFISGYAESAVPEDKASLGAELITALHGNVSYRDILRADTPLRKKFVLLFARLLDRDRASALYFALANTRHDHSMK